MLRCSLGNKVFVWDQCCELGDGSWTVQREKLCCQFDKASTNLLESSGVSTICQRVLHWGGPHSSPARQVRLCSLGWPRGCLGPGGRLPAAVLWVSVVRSLVYHSKYLKCLVVTRMEKKLDGVMGKHRMMGGALRRYWTEIYRNWGSWGGAVQGRARANAFSRSVPDVLGNPNEASGWARVQSRGAFGHCKQFTSLEVLVGFVPSDDCERETVPPISSSFWFC